MKETETTSLFKALADESRLRIMRVLLTGRFNVNELVSIVEMGQSRVSRHLKLLLGAGLAQVTRQGTWAYYEASTSNGGGLLPEQLRLLRKHSELLPGNQQDEARRQECLESRRQRSRSFSDRVAPNWARLRAELLGDSAASAQALEALQGAAVVADLGCGAGELLPELARRADRVIGVDSSPSMLEQARKVVSASDPEGEHGAVELRLGNLEHLPLADGEADGVLLSMVLHHLAEPPAVLREARRALAPKGQLVVCDLAPHDEEWMREEHGDQWLGFSADELRRFFREAGLEIVELTQYKDPSRVGVQVAVARASTQGADR